MHRPTERDSLRERVFAGRMRQDAHRRRAAVARKGGRRLIAVFAGLGVVAGLLTVTQLASSALEDSEGGLGAGAGCDEVTVTIEEVDASEDLELHIEEESDGTVHHHYRKKRGNGGDGDQQAPPPAPDPNCEEGGSGGEDDGDGSDDGTGPGDGDGSGDDGTGDGDGTTPGNPGTNPGGADGENNGLDILGRNCNESDLPLHTGFQAEEAQCVNAHMGEVPAVQNNPTLLITDFPQWVATDESFTITISTRNLVRDRFLGAGVGGYYLESSFLDENGIQRGHVHMACLELSDPSTAPTATQSLEPAFFVAIEDGGGGAGESSFTVEVPPLENPGMYRCMAWAGDPSHRMPMMSFARMQIASDAVRITATEDGAGEE